MSEIETKPKYPWLNEPDRKSWTDETSGLDCLIIRGPSGSLCGYVGVPASHPAYGRVYSHLGYDVDDVLSGKAAEDAPLRKQIQDIEVHGGLTFASKGDGDIRPRDLWWFGFDCAHAGDYSPKSDHLTGPLGLGQPTGWGGVIEYRDMDYVTKECGSLARQLAAIHRVTEG